MGYNGYILLTIYEYKHSILKRNIPYLASLFGYSVTLFHTDLKL